MAQVSAKNLADNVQIKPKVVNEKSQPAIDEHAQLLIEKADLDRIDETSVALLQAAREDEEEKLKLISESNSTSISSATLQEDLHSQNQMDNSVNTDINRLVKSNDDNNTLIEANPNAGELTEEATAFNTNTGNIVFESAAGASFFSSSSTNSFPVENLPSSERVLSSSSLSSPNELLPLAENQNNSSIAALNTS